MQTPAYPLRFAPVPHARLWGGDRIARRYHRTGLPAQCGESWEISAHPDGRGPLLNGPWAGLDLAELTRKFGRELIGAATPEPDRFPLLFKIIDARIDLSVQVHPNAAAARTLGGESKHESWYLLDGRPESALYAGMLPGMEPARFGEAMRTGTVAACLHTLPAVPGGTLDIPGGLVHAIGAGCLVYEVQQNANTTYRLFDWNRRDASGRPRTLHLREGLSAIDWTLPPPRLHTPPDLPDAWQTCCETPFFTLRTIRLTRPGILRPDGLSFHALFVAEGSCDVATDGGIERLETGASCLIPACVAEYSVTPLGGEARLLKTVVATGGGRQRPH